jgi:FtsZ-binding cell division protein ZapB
MISSSLYAQEEIIWSKRNTVEWKDFKAQPQMQSPQAASINTGIQYSWKTEFINGKQVLNYKVYAYMKPSKSWVKPSEKSDYLLEHEQLHFDITEYHARKLKQAFDHYELEPSIKNDLKRIYRQIVKERITMQNQYDKETQHSLNRMAQKQWQEKVRALLKEIR